MAQPIILWVDDDVDDLELFSRAVQEIAPEAQVIPAHNGEEALAFLASADEAGKLPGLIVLDMNMPRLGGRETLAILKGSEAYKELNVVVFTTSQTTLDQLFCAKWGVEMFTKPNGYGALKELVGRFLESMLRPVTEGSGRTR